MDDLLISAPSSVERDIFIKSFQQRFTITVHTGASLDYLGMHIDIVQGKVVLSQVPMIEKIVDGITGKATSPVED